MNVLGVLCFAAAVLTVNARHKREWEFLDMKKATREILMPLYRSETPICHKGPGFYRDPNDCHQYIRCVDDFSSGRRLTLFVGRCRPGLVFDENVSSCNWPELAAPCRNSPEHFKDPASKLNPKEPNTQHVTQDNKISDQSGYWNKYQSQQQKPNKHDQKLQEPVDGIKNVFQETEAQEKIGQSFEESQEPQVQITEQEREPQVAESFEEIPNNKGHQQIPVSEQIPEPVIQEKDEPLSQDQVIQQQSEQISKSPDIQKKVTVQQIKESSKAKEPVIQESQQVQENPKTRQPVIQEQTQQVQENPKTRQPVIQEQTQQVQENLKTRRPVIQKQTQQSQENPKKRQPIIQEQTQQVQENPKKEPVIQQQNEHVSKDDHREAINQQQNQKVPVWDEEDAQEKIYHPVQDQEQIQNPVVQDKQRINGQQQNIYDNNLASQFQEQVPSGFFQEIPDSETSQSQWWVPESQSSESTAILGIADQNDKHRGEAAPTTLEEPILCSNEGFFRHPKNCSRFFRCVKNEEGSFSIYFFQCAKHLAFDEKISHCTDSENIKCSSRRPKRQADDIPLECSGEGFFRHPKDCRSFYRCVKHESGDYETHLFSCPANLVFDEEYATCNWPDKAPPCDTRAQFWKPTRASISTPSRPSFKPYQRTTAKGYKSTTKPRNDFIESSNPFTSERGASRIRTTQKPKYTTQSSSNSGQLCNTPGFYRHDQDCTKFYKCVKNGNYFVRYELSCPKNYAYDEISSRCVSQKYASSCNGRNNYPPFRQNDDEPSTTTESEVADDGNQSSSEDDGIECTEAGYFRNPNDCNKFYRCVDFSGEGQEFVRYDFSCPEGLVFDEKKSICNWPDPTAPCEAGSNSGNGEDEPSVLGGEDESEDTSSSTTPRSTTESEGRSTPKKDNSTARPKENTPKPGKSTSRPKDSTPKPERSTSKPQQTTPTSEESSEQPSKSDNGCNEEGFFRNPEDCNKFYRCVDSGDNGQGFLRYDFDCPKGLVFDETNSVCNWPDASAPCEAGNSGGGNEEDESNENESDEESSTTPRSVDESGRRSTTTTKKQTDKSTPKPGRSTSKPKENTPKPGKSTSRPNDSTPKPERSTSKPKQTTPTSKKAQSNQSKSESAGNGGGGNEEDESNENESDEESLTTPRSVDESGRRSTTTTKKQTDKSTPKPGRSTSKPKESTSKPGRSTSRPREGTSQPGRSTSKPRESTSKPGKSTSRPRENTPKPEGSTPKPGESTTGADESSKEPEESNSENGCSADGFFRNPEDCNKFYRCVDFNGDGQEFVRYDFDCPEGLVFDEENSVCNWPSEVDDCGSRPGGGSNKNKKESSTSSTQKDQDSTTAKPTTQKGRDSTTQKPSTQKDRESTTKQSTQKGRGTTTVKPSTQKGRGSTTPRPRTTAEESQTDEDNSMNTEEPESSSSITESSSSDKESSTSSGSKRRGSSNGECKEEGFFRNPDDCNKFYRCVDYNGDGKEFVKYDFSCPDGLVFDEENSVCNWPEQAAPCEGNSGKEGSSTEQDENESSTTSTTGKRDETSTASTTTRRESSTTRRTTKSPSGRSTRRPQSTKSPSDKTTKRPQVTKSTTIAQSTTSSEESTDSSTATSRKETTKDETSESTKQESDGECTEEGFFRNPDDCGKFYRCVDFDGDGKQFVKYDFDCPDGLYFDEVNSVCNWPEQSPPCETASKGKGETTESSGSTSKTDSTTQSETQSTSTMSSTTQSAQSTSTTTTQSTTKSNEPTSTSKATSTTSSKESECSEPGFFRCQDDCNKFYRCVDDGQQLVRYDFKCPEGLIFDDKNKRCDFPSEELSCDIESTSTTPSSTQSTTQAATQTTGKESTSGSTTTSSESSTKSSKECTEEGYFRDPDDCSKYYRCLDEGDGTLTREDFSCAEDEVFDEEMRYCNRKDLAPPCEEGATSTGSQSTTLSGTSSKECTEEGYFRDPDDCSKYYRCLDEGDGTLTREDFSCAEDEVFDEEMRYCNRKDLAPPCEEGTTSTGSQSTTPSGTSTTSETSVTSSTSSTTSDESTTEGSRQSGCRKEGFFRCEEDCNKFYRCIDEDGNGNYKRYNFSCPEGLIFDEKNERCDWPSEELTCDTETTGSSTTSRDSTTSSTSTGTTSSGSTSTSSSDECTEEGYFRNPDDCSKYYRCLDEGDGTFTREDFSCAEDEVFDDEMNYCNRKDLAPACEETSSTPGSSTSTIQSGSTNTDSESSTTEAISSTTSSKTTTQATSSATESSESTTNEENGATRGTTEGSTEKNTKSGECEEEGFHRHPDDCNKFYRCVDFAGDGQSYTRYDFECPEGLVFDETNNVCNWPSSVPSCESSEGKSTTSSDMEVTSTTQGDRSTSATDSDTTSTSTTKGSSTTGTTSGSTSEETDSSTTSTGTTSSTGSTSSDKKSEDAECTEEGFFRNPDDCTKFYRCVDFAGTGESYTRYDFECPDDLVFDDVNNVCNWPNMSPGCESSSKSEKNESKSTTSKEESTSSTSESTTNTDGSQSTGTTAGESTGTTSGDSTTTGESTGTTSGDGMTTGESTGTTSKDSTTTTSGTRATSSTTSGTESDDFQCEEEGFFRHPKDCKKYYECKRDEDTGEMIKIDCECPEGHVFDEEGWYCNAEELSPPCDDGSFKCEKEGFFRDPEDCTKYYYCNQTGSGFRKESFQCTDGNVFDEEGRYCNAPELTEPCNSTSSTSSSSVSGTTPLDENTTPGSGTSSNPTSSTSSEASSSSTSSDQQECTEEGFFRNPEDCTKYYQCTRNEDSGEFERKDFTCPDGRVFDEEGNYCNDPELSDKPCDSSSTSSSTQGQTDNSSSSSTKSGGGPGTRRGGGDPECTQAGFFRHPKDCNKFYRCVDFAGTGESYVRYDFDCPEGLHFDEVNSTCNWPTMTPRCENESE
ncbi:putative endochitinase like protein [Argiope bruennichi]|uniref:Putative endochitinase like protein n=1 Tax=Argiope bruennichi TaxID=94029 RepID=A0A8T0F9P5_ARGBR|nr:putative endochitinase like protein [Argiope bruennichi]